MSGKGTNPKEQIPCPKCGSRVQRRNMRKRERSMHQGVRRRRHVCPYCSAEKCRTYSTFLDWKNHLLDTHEHCLENDDPLQREEYAAGFKLDRWERFHDLEGNENDRAYLRCADLGYILYTKPLILEEVKRDVLFDGRDPGSVGNGTAVSPPLTGAIMSPGSKQLFPSFLPESQAPTSGTRQTPLTRSNAGTRNGINVIVCRSSRWKRVGA